MHSLDTTSHTAEWEEFDLAALDLLRISILGLRPSHPRKGHPSDCEMKWVPVIHQPLDLGPEPGRAFNKGKPQTTVMYTYPNLNSLLICSYAVFLLVEWCVPFSLGGRCEEVTKDKDLAETCEFNGLVNS